MSKTIRASVTPYIGIDGVVLRIFINGNESSEFYRLKNSDVQIANDLADERLSQIKKMMKDIKWRAIK